ncbi:MAG TPA: 2-phospho-L-lactate transferase [Acidimicrobiales bacterium]|nr:2-phospho-L-lactate transferase [Acidimicrobiales bacterium]
MITALAGGVGAARLLRGLVRVVPPEEVTAVVNTADDMVYCGLHISPDIDTVTRTLAGRFNEVKGYGVADDTWTVLSALGQMGGDTWFELGDQDLATHMFRSRRLEQGHTLSQVTAELAAAAGLATRLLPVTDDPLRTRVTLRTGQPTGQEVSFQEYFAKLRHAVPVSSIRFDGADTARPAPGVLDAVDAADLVVVCPSNPLLSIDPLLAVAGLRPRLQARRDRNVAVSPIVGGKAIKGPADRLLDELGLEPSAAGVAAYYAPWVGTVVIDQVDRHLAPEVEALGLRCVVTDTIMATPERSAALAAAVLRAGGIEPVGQAG